MGENRVDFKSVIRHANEKWVLNHVPNLEGISDLLGENKDGVVSDSSILFYILPRIFGRLLENDPDTVLSKRSIAFRRKCFHNTILKLGPSFLNGKKLIKEKLAELPTGRPLIFAPNHGFLEDPMSSVLMAERQAYLLFGSLPQFFNTFNGIAAYLNGSILINRKNKASRRASVDKAVRALELGADLILYPEGVINKSANNLTLNYWPGIIEIARKSNALIIPIVHLMVGDKIHSSRLEAFDATQYGIDETFKALDDLQTIVNTELWSLMEKFAKSSRSAILGTYDQMTDACEAIVKGQVDTLGKFYDYAIECSADYRKPKIIREIDVWKPIAQLEINRYNAAEVLYARNRVSILQREDYQRRF